MVGSPEHSHRRRRARWTIRLGREETRADSFRWTAGLFFLRLAAALRLAQRSDSRSERRLPVQRAHGTAPPDHTRGAAAASRWRAGLDATSRIVATGRRTS